MTGNIVFSYFQVDVVAYSISCHVRNVKIDKLVRAAVDIADDQLLVVISTKKREKRKM